MQIVSQRASGQSAWLAFVRLHDLHQQHSPCNCAVAGYGFGAIGTVYTTSQSSILDFLDSSLSFNSTCGLYRGGLRLQVNRHSLHHLSTLPHHPTQHASYAVAGFGFRTIGIACVKPLPFHRRTECIHHSFFYQTMLRSFTQHSI